MAVNNFEAPTSELQEIRNLLWGPNIKEDVFRRWAQGFYFSKYEPTALIQSEGGPCAVIAPVQAYILKILLNESVGNNWREVDAEHANELLVQAVCNILTLASSHIGGKFILVHLNNINTQDLIDQQNTNPIEHEHFHEKLRILSLDSIQEVKEYYISKIETLKETFGVLLLLYSVISTKGLEQIRSEMNDSCEPLIDSTFGYGSQSLINLMLTGRAVGHIFDHERDVGGLKLRGIDKQNDVGFLAFLEHLRLCEVGSFLKNPKSPVWVIGSETHLTVLFSWEQRLVGAETPYEIARRIFKSFDPEGNNFIPCVLLQDVLSGLELVSETEYVEIMKRKLDPEGLGIILLNAFMDEFFPEKPSTPDTFILYHYNGLARSCFENKVVYQEGSAVLLEQCDLKSVSETNAMLTCLQTKWPNIDVQWTSGITPSLN